MDPLNFISVVRTAVQFTDYGVRLLSESVQTYKGTSDTIVKVVELEKISRDLTEFATAVENEIIFLKSPNRLRTISEESLLEECRTCRAISEDILQAISKIQGRGVKNVDFQRPRNRYDKESFRDALRIVWNKDKIEEMGSRLRKNKSRLMEAMISDLWKRPTEKAELIVDEGTATRHQTLIQQLHSEDRSAAHAPTLDSIFTYHQQEQATGISDVDCVKYLLKDLYFQSQDSRFDAIPDAYKSTFRWAFEEPPQSEDGSDQPLWSSLPVWLKNEADNIYWITGKPGSGKSTIMKYLLSQSRMTYYLAEWASPRPVLTATFYSWNAGTELQKTQIGLLRTLLYQIIEKAPETAPRILPGRWATLKLFGQNTTSKIPWTWRELSESITSLCSLEKKFNLALFVDGLDEFDGDHSQLIDLIKQFHGHPRIKVCVSSRPWNDFRDAFAGCPQMRMEMLTKEDMEKFVRGNFSVNPGFAELQAASPTDAEELLQGIVEKAQGVFIWVYLVTKEMLASLTDGAMSPDFIKILTDLPSDLEALYHGLWERIKPIHRHDAARLLLMFQTYTQSSIPPVNREDGAEPAGMPADTMWFADGGGMPSNYGHIIQALTRRLNSRTKGILEISSGRVDYYHRTALEWLEKVWPTIQSAAPEDFDAHLAILRGVASSAAQPRNWPLDSEGRSILFSSDDVIWKWLLRGFYLASKVVDNPQNCSGLVKALDDLSSALTTIYSGYRTQIIPQLEFLTPDSAQRCNFVILAAELGIVPYVRAKVMSNPDYLKIESGDNNLLFRLILGMPRGRISGRILDFSRRNGIGPADYKFIDNFVLDNIAYNGVGRYQLAVSFTGMLTDDRKGKLRAYLRQWDIYKELMLGYSEDKKQQDYGQVVPIEGSNGLPYSIAITKLFESYDAKMPIKDWLRLLWMRLRRKV
ncbi:hypothetical protein PT974_05034 [Cladobotryum mycophilum]|uniref:Nephrocystin 3-like N-terminal domain-containing protein n=1 Tax=Cladobotryum mycophilum TaxID=491253 RepID=A0ABR0SQV1_9HYPO